MSFWNGNNYKQKIIVSLTKLQLHVDLSVSFRNGQYRWILWLEESVYSFGHSFQGATSRVKRDDSLPLRVKSSVTTRSNRTRDGRCCPPDDLRGPPAVVDVGLLVCPDCQRAFKGKQGLAQHRRCAHLEKYHLENMPQPCKKARWEQEELFILAKTELALRGSGVKFINQRCCRSPRAEPWNPSRKCTSLRNTVSCWTLYSRSLIAVSHLN